MQERKDKWTVGQWMTPNPATIEPDASVRAAFIQMRHRGFRHLPVVQDKKMVGMITDRDLRRPDISKDVEGWNDFYKLDEDCEVRYVMTTEVKSVYPNDSIEKAVALFIEHKFGALPVLDKNDELIGILSAHDVLNAFQEALDQVGELLRKKS